MTMIEVGVVEQSAEARRRLTNIVERWAWVNPEARNVALPRLSIRPLAPEEVRYHGSLDLCLVGPELIVNDAAQCGIIRKLIPNKILIAVIDEQSHSFGTIEALSRLGIDDVILSSSPSDEFYRRIILLSRRIKQPKTGELCIVQSAKGSCGSTFVSAGLSEAIFLSGKHVVLVDADVENQELSRFLQSRPHVNESLRLILDQQRTVTAETVREALIPVWSDSDRLQILVPPANSDSVWLSSPKTLRTFISVLECLTTMADIVIVDASRLPSTARQLLSQVAQHLVYVMNRDPSSAYSFRNSLSSVKGAMKSDAQLHVVINSHLKSNLTTKIIKEEIIPHGLTPDSITDLPYSSRASRWICSGTTPAHYMSRPFGKLARKLDAPDEQKPGSENVHTSDQSRRDGELKGTRVFAKLRHATEFMFGLLPKLIRTSSTKTGTANSSSKNQGGVVVKSPEAELLPLLSAPKTSTLSEVEALVSSVVMTAQDASSALSERGAEVNTSSELVSPATVNWRAENGSLNQELGK